MAEKIQTIMIEVPAHQAEAFSQMTREFFVQAHGRQTSGQPAAEVRARDRDTGLDSLMHLARLAEGDTGQCGIVARFLGVVAVLIPATIFGLNIGTAIIFHEGSTLLVVVNALRLLAFQHGAPRAAPQGEAA